MKHTDNKKLFYILPVLVLIGIFGFLLYTSDRTSQTHTITLTESGFNPVEITINKGDTVVFKSNISGQFWPASDLHPTHGIYPEFDPQQPVESSSIWEFKFEKPGKWRFHDHLTPIYRGTIHVNN